MTKLTLHEFIKKYKINQKFIAKKIRMNESTFKHKLNKKFKLEFTETELKKINEAIYEIGSALVHYSWYYYIFNNTTQHVSETETE